jgi:hypothetical protein
MTIEEYAAARDMPAASDYTPFAGRSSERIRALEQLQVPPARMQPKESALSASFKALERELRGPDNGALINEVERRMVETAKRICSDPELLKDYHLLMDEKTLTGHADNQISI